MSITTTRKIFQSQTGHKAQDTLEYAIGINNLPGSTFGVGDGCVPYPSNRLGKHRHMTDRSEVAGQSMMLLSGWTDLRGEGHPTRKGRAFG